MEESNKFYKLINKKLSIGEPELAPDFQLEVEQRLIKEGLLKGKSNNNKWIYLGLLLISVSIFGLFYSEDVLVNSDSKPENNIQSTFTNSNGTNTNTTNSHELNSHELNSNEPNSNKPNSKGKINNNLTTILSNSVATDLPVQSNSASNPVARAPYSSTDLIDNDYKTLSPTNRVANINYTESGTRENNNEIFSLANAPSQQVVLETEIIPSNPSTVEIIPEAISLIEEKRDSIIKDSVISTPEVVNESPLEKGPVSFTMDLFAGPQISALRNSGGGKGNSKLAGSSSEFVFGINGNIYRKNFTLGLGINYSKFSSSFSTNYPYTYDSTEYKIPIRVETDLSILDIPLIAGYLVNMGKFAIQLEAGASLSFIVNTTSVINIDTLNMKLNNDSINPASSYSNLVAQVGFLYSINNRLSCFIQPSMRYGLTEVLRDEPLQKINTYSIRAGLRVKF